MKHLTHCPACASPANKLRSVRCLQFSQQGYALETQLVECPCGHVFTNPQPSRDELLPFYSGEYHVFAQVPLDAAAIDRLIARQTTDDRFNHLKVVPGGRYLDIGCGLGTMVAAMSRLGMSAEGIEPSPIAAQKARNYGLKVFCGVLEEAQFDSELFDCISMYHVLEHTHDPVGTLRECRRLLKPEGEIIIGVPNYDSLMLTFLGSDWIGLTDPSHLHYFRPASLRSAAGCADLRIKSIETESLVEHVEGELAKWLRIKFYVPRRLTLRTRVLRPLVAHLASVGNRSGRGEAIVARMEKI